MTVGYHLALYAAAAAALQASSLAISQPARLPSRGPVIEAIEGVYRHRFTNGDIAGDKYTSEDVLELVKLTPETGYFRIHGEFFNGHICDI